MGQIIKRGNVWTIIYQHTAPDGTRKPKWESCKGLTWNQAKARLRDRETRDSRGEPVQESKITVSDYLAIWLDRIKGTIADSTWHEYQRAMRNHLLPAWGTLPLTRLQPGMIQDQYRAWGKRLAPKSVRNLHSLIHRALKQAVRWEYLFRNPADAVEPPKVLRPEIAMPTAEEARRLLKALYPREWYLPALICLGTGMRRSEALALQWKDYDAARGVLVVQRALSRIRDSDIRVKDTKSGRVRVIAIGAKLRRLLNWHRLRSPHTHPGDWICCHADGTHLSPTGLTRAFLRAASKLGFKANVHSLRHLHITALIEAGVPVKAVSERAGHSSVQITQDRYAHVIETIQQQAVIAAETLLGG